MCNDYSKLLKILIFNNNERHGKLMAWKLLCYDKETCDFNIVTVTNYPSKCRQGIWAFKELWIIEKCSVLNWLRVSVKWAIRDSVTQNSSAPKVNYFQKWNWRVSWVADNCTSSANTFFSMTKKIMLGNEWVASRQS